MTAPLNAPGPLNASPNSRETLMKSDREIAQAATEGPWRAIPGWPAYEVRPDGLVRHGRRMLKLTPQRGYVRVRLFRDGYATSISVQVGRLVLLAHVGVPAKGIQCRHLNGVRDDNRLENLAWGTCRENIHDKFAHGTMACGERHGRAKLNAEQVRVIRRAAGDRVGLAREYGVSPRTIEQIIDGETWRHLLPLGSSQ